MKTLAACALLLAAGCASQPDMVVQDRESVPSLDSKRKVTEQDCSKPVDLAAGNLMCK